MIAIRQKYDRAVEKARSVRLQAIENAKRQYISELEKAIAVAMKAHQLDEANRIKAQIDALQ